ncbi:peptidase M23 [Herminiimonas sp. KBW02]|uniref:peptidoglycan DD-metalloendopeptidase family protein n=1 Tax=Herminiimonas sp. KBW02 TaxID=2153363 RepID=UPI000F596FF1|nr:peptidoglycan DD-metalloendopeptidase family protein [Herminiimonas sp. KBW02]RQO36183.1 peptidase M23 [Herminiimonas sp. KBW02]
MRINTTRQIFLISLVGLLSACSSTQNSAPVSERRIGGTTTPPKAAVEDRTSYTVRKGDTLYRIALDFGQSYSEIVAWNNLANPNDIKVGQVLRVAPPDAASGRSGGAQIGTIASSSGVESRPLGPPSGATASTAASNKTSPRGEKKPYSDATLAEMQKPDSAQTAATAPVPVASTAKPAAPTEPAAPVTLATDDDSVSWMWPAEGKVVGTFDDGRKGLDIAGKSGQAVMAAGAGKVMYAGSGIRGYGNLVIVKHTSNLLSAYAHNKAILVKEGQNVNKGQKIAEMGDSDSDSVKLHFEIRQQGKPVDPSKFLPGR